jgi:hypothetical protein
LVHVSRDGGGKWENVTANVTGLPEWGTVCCIEASPFDAETAYVVVDGHKLDDMKPYLFKTADGGKTWKKLSDSLPADVYLRAVREDPKRKGLLFVGTEKGIAFSTDGGANWQPLKLNLPTTAVSDLVIKDTDLVVGTNGRSIWVLDDLTPLREMTPVIAAKDTYLFSVQPAVRYRYHGSFEEGERRGAGANPPKGAIIHYHLKAKPKGDVTLQIVNDKNEVVATMSSKPEPEEKVDDGDYLGERPKKTVLPTEAGLHRVVWDLQYEGAKVIPGARVDSGQPKVGPLANPGKYTVKLTVDGKTETTELTVLIDPRLLDSHEPLRLRVDEFTPGNTQLGRPNRRDVIKESLDDELKIALKIRDDISRLTGVVIQLRSVKTQLTARNELLKDDAKAEALVKSSKELITKLDELEEKLHNPKAKVAYDVLAQKGGAKLYSQLVWLFEWIKDSDGRPTQGLKEVYEEQALLLKKYELEWQVLLAGDLAKLNEEAKKLELPGVIVPAGKEKPKKEKEKEKRAGPTSASRAASGSRARVRP